MNSIPQTASSHTANDALRIEESDPAMLESEGSCDRGDVLMFFFWAIATIVIQTAALSFS